MSNPIEIPPEVQALIDEAYEKGLDYTFTETAVQILQGAEVVREVQWAAAGQFRRNLITNVLATNAQSSS